MPDLLPLRVSVGGQRALILPHAIRRYAERASGFPDDVDRARRQLGQVVAAIGELAPEPEWIHKPRPGQAVREEQATVYLLLGADVAFPLAERRSGLVALTCVCRGGVSDLTREKRRERRKRRGTAVRESRSMRAWVGDRAPPRWN